MLAFSPDGKTLAGGSDDRAIYVWDIETESLRDILRGHTCAVTSLAFSPDGTTLASGSADGTGFLWKMAPLPDPRIRVTPFAVECPPISKQLTFTIDVADRQDGTDFQLTLQFDATALQYISRTNGDILHSGHLTTPPIVNENAVTFAGKVSTKTGTLASVTFEIIVQKASTVTVSDAILFDGGGERSYPILATAWIVESAQIEGDVNGDGHVNAQDLAVVASRLGQTGHGNKADVNSDGVVDIADLVWITNARYIPPPGPSID